MSSPDAPLTLPFARVRAADLPRVGGKGANLGELTHAGFPVPPGFCVTTAAFRRFLAGVELDALYEQLEGLDGDDAAATSRLAGEVRARLLVAPVPPEVGQAVLAAWADLGTGHACAVRSSATAEDLPDASFAGQQDTFLNVRGADALLDAVRRCWASLFTDRAVAYRARRGLGHREVELAVVVQRLVVPEVSGILFTADPVTGRRSVSRIDASFGLGEALVGGLVSADAFAVDRERRCVTERRISEKALVVEPDPAGGVRRVELTGPDRTRPALTDTQALALSDLGARIEAHFGAPQDIEWALAGGQFFVLQARPITTLFPLPGPRPTDGLLHASLSFGHLQMMTDALPPLAASVWRTVFPLARDPRTRESVLVSVAGGRLYVDVSALLRHPVFRRAFPRLMSALGDALVGSALAELAARPEFARGPRIRTRAILNGPLPGILRRALAHLLTGVPERSTRDASRLVEAHLRRAETRLAAAPDLPARLEVATDLLTHVLGTLLSTLFPRVVAGVLADGLLRRLGAPLASRPDLASLTRGLDGNVTTDMDLALADLADAARPFPALVERLRRPDLPSRGRLRVADLPGGAAFLRRWHDFLAVYGDRGPAEIDVSRPRWREDPTSLLNMLAGQLAPGEAGTHRAHLARLREEARRAGARLLRAAGPRRTLLRRLIRVARGHLAVREHPKFLLVGVLGLVRSVVREAAVLLTARGQLDAPGDVWFLTLPELRGALADPSEPWQGRVAERRSAFTHAAPLTPPRVLTSDGEGLSGTHTDRRAPPGALVGQPVSAGIAEGPVRVVLDPGRERLHPGEILVAPFTDPGWTPLFIPAAGLVTEVGGLMTHGSVVAREYGLPAVVGVEGATTRLRTGQRVRVHGDLGYVEVLGAEAPAGGP